VLFLADANFASSFLVLSCCADLVRTIPTCLPMSQIMFFLLLLLLLLRLRLD
jgi:hypothetical protein